MTASAAHTADRRRLALQRFEAAYQIARSTPLLVIVRQVSAKYRVSPRDIFAHRGSMRFALPRKECWWRARNETRLSYGSLARYFDRDHSAIIKGVQSYETYLLPPESGTMGLSDG